MNIEVVCHPALTTPLKNFPKKSKENRHLKIWIIGSKEFIQKESFLNSVHFLTTDKSNFIALICFIYKKEIKTCHI